MANLEKLKTLIPLHLLEQEAQQQIYNNLKLDIVEKMAIMPDCHAGYSLPIGGVALVHKAISPVYVGYDIGCGMTCIVTDIPAKELTQKRIDKIFNKIYNTIPVGFNMREHGLFYDEFKSASGDKQLNLKVNGKLFKQLGTLGGGNHFIEIGKNQNNKVTVTLHSGSRNPGHTVATFYMEMSNIEDKHLPNGFLDIESDLGRAYIEDMNSMLTYALDNRRTMMQEILTILKCNIGLMNNMINETHNHAIVQEDGKVLHRKGATESNKRQLGVIPGNMRDGVYIVEGLGNQEYLCSSSHGAGRKGSRNWAKKTISMGRFRETMSGIKAKVDKGTLDESPDAYKNINEVIRAQDGVVVNVVDYVKPIINVKG